MEKLKYLCRLEYPQYSPNGIRTTIRILLFLVLWPIASLDFNSLAALKSLGYFWGHHFKFENFLADFIQQNILSSVRGINVTQIAAAILIILAIIKPTRLFVALSLLPVLMIELVAYRYRVQFYDIDFALACLLLTVFLPINWQKAILEKTPESNYRSTSVGLTILTFVSCAYFLAGLSKLKLDLHWWEHVDLGALYAVMDIWHGAEFKGLYHDIVKAFSDFFYLHPVLDQISSFIALIAELSYPLVLFFAFARILMPFNMSMVHIMILVSSGISFHSMGLTALAIILPSLIPSLVHRSQVGFPKMKGTLIAYSLVGLFFSGMPSLLQDNIHPFTNHMQFGWSYAAARNTKSVVTAGVFVENSVRPLPLDYGGFFGFRHYSGFQSELGYLFPDDHVAMKPDEIELHLKRLKIFCAALTEHNSNKRLGWFSFPDHMMVNSTDIGKVAQSDLVVMRRDVKWEGNQHLIQNSVMIGKDDKPMHVCKLTPDDINSFFIR